VTESGRPEIGGAGARAPVAPPGVRLAAAVRWMLVLAAGLLAAASFAQYFGLTGTAAARSQIHHCPMHPRMVREGPGDCAICGMSLVPGPAGRFSALPVKGGKPVAAGKFHCPMHPDVASDDPNARCEACGGMKLLPRASGPPQVDVERNLPAGMHPLELQSEKVQLIGVRTAEVTRQTLATRLELAGVIAVHERGIYQITPRFSGYIEQLRAWDTGRPVRAGEPLATIMSPELLRLQEELLASLKQPAAAHARSDDGPQRAAYRRLEQLGIARQEIADVIKTGRPLGALAIRAPIDGFIVDSQAVAGGPVHAGTPLFVIADLSTVWVLADVPQEQTAVVRPGQRAQLKLSTYPGGGFNGRVEYLYPTLDAVTHTVRLRMEFRNHFGRAGPKLRPGMWGTVLIEAPGQPALVAPAEAVIETGDDQYVFVAQGAGRYRPRRVKLGRSWGDYREILAGLSAGESVVTTGNFLLDSESRLRATLAQ
jgi:membrane fusion protein, copper/silver efflux system